MVINLAQQTEHLLLVGTWGMDGKLQAEVPVKAG